MKKKNEMLHMGMKWKVKVEFKVTLIVTCGRNYWYVANVCGGLPGDESGLKTARAICDAHNKALEEGRITQ